MSVFDGKTATRLAVADPSKDHRLPSPASLSFAAIAGPSPLKSTLGQHCELVHGDHWDETSRTFTQHVGRDVATTVMHNQSHKVMRHQQVTVAGHHKETLASVCRQTVLGPHQIFNGTVRNETRLGAYTEVYGKEEIHDDQDGNTIVGVDHDERFKSSTLTHYLDVQSFGMAFSLVGITLGAYGAGIALKLFLDFSLALVHAEATLLHMESHLHHTEDHDGPPGLPAV